MFRSLLFHPCHRVSTKRQVINIIIFIIIIIIIIIREDSKLYRAVALYTGAWHVELLEFFRPRMYSGQNCALKIINL